MCLCLHTCQKISGGVSSMTGRRHVILYVLILLTFYESQVLLAHFVDKSCFPTKKKRTTRGSWPHCREGMSWRVWVRPFWWRGVYSGLIGILVDMYIITHSLIHTYMSLYVWVGRCWWVKSIRLWSRWWLTCMCTHTRLYRHIRLYICTYIYIYICILYIYIYIYVCVCTHAYIHAYMYICVKICIYTYMHTCIHYACMHTYMHTLEHTHTCSLSHTHAHTHMYY